MTFLISIHGVVSETLSVLELHTCNHPLSQWMEPEVVNHSARTSISGNIHSFINYGLYHSLYVVLFFQHILFYY